MKTVFAIFLLVSGVCVACASRQTTSQTTQNPPDVTSASPSQTPGTTSSDKLPCSMAMEHAPVVYGLRIGLTLDEVLALFPGIKDDAEVRASVAVPPSPIGVSSFIISPDKYGSKDKFAGVNQITFTLLDGRVSKLHIGYNGPEYPHVDKFVEKFVEGTNLPAGDAWDPYVGMDNQLKTLKCRDFEIRVFAGGQGGNLNHVIVHDLVADKALKERRAKARQKASP